MAEKRTLPPGAMKLIQGFRDKRISADRFEEQLSLLTTDDKIRQKIRRIAAGTSDLYLQREAKKRKPAGGFRILEDKTYLFRKRKKTQRPKSRPK